MTNTYAWTLQAPPRVSKSLDGMTNVIRSVDWRVTAADQSGKYSATRYGGPLELSAPNPASFTPFEQVTLDMLMGWVQIELGAAQVTAATTAMDTQIAAAIAADADPSTPVPMPLMA